MLNIECPLFLFEISGSTNLFKFANQTNVWQMLQNAALSLADFTHPQNLEVAPSVQPIKIQNHFLINQRVWRNSDKDDRMTIAHFVLDPIKNYKMV
jgi:hypothetical protein